MRACSPLFSSFFFATALDKDKCDQSVPRLGVSRRTTPAPAPAPAATSAAASVVLVVVMPVLVFVVTVAVLVLARAAIFFGFSCPGSRFLPRPVLFLARACCRQRCCCWLRQWRCRCPCLGCKAQGLLHELLLTPADLVDLLRAVGGCSQLCAHGLLRERLAPPVGLVDQTLPQVVLARAVVLDLVPREGYLSAAPTPDVVVHPFPRHRSFAFSHSPRVSVVLAFFIRCCFRHITEHTDLMAFKRHTWVENIAVM